MCRCFPIFSGRYVLQSTVIAERMIPYVELPIKNRVMLLFAVSVDFHTE